MEFKTEPFGEFIKLNFPLFVVMGIFGGFTIYLSSFIHDDLSLYLGTTSSVILFLWMACSIYLRARTFNKGKKIFSRNYKKLIDTNIVSQFIFKIFFGIFIFSVILYVLRYQPFIVYSIVVLMALWFVVSAIEILYIGLMVLHVLVNVIEIKTGQEFRWVNKFLFVASIILFFIFITSIACLISIKPQFDSLYTLNTYNTGIAISLIIFALLSFLGIVLSLLMILNVIDKYWLEKKMFDIGLIPVTSQDEIIQNLYKEMRGVNNKKVIEVSKPEQLAIGESMKKI